MKLFEETKIKEMREKEEVEILRKKINKSERIKVKQDDNVSL